ncbi:hypothetical protein BDV93DRAFT_611413 [Ceratobasidium sp. AG-I]|nr:hypothetical protein BDV93DRAFT_611413 [Ceratobasidium sp. AG-I]
MSIRRALERSLTFPARKPKPEQYEPSLAPFSEEDRSPISQPELILVHPSLRRKQSHAASTHSDSEQLFALRALIAQCDAEDSELRAALSNVRARKQQAVARLHALMRTPANRLSPPILSLIFQYLDMRTIESSIMLVSKRWKRTALSIPELWNTIPLHRGPACARAYIRRARGLPLIVELSLPDPLHGDQISWALSNLKRAGDAEILRERNIERLLAPALPLISTWSAFRVRAPDVFSMQTVLALCAEAGGTKALRELVLAVARLSDTETSVSDFSQIENFLNLEGETLKRVSLTNMAWQWSPYALGSVADLSITLTNEDEVGRVYDLPSYFGTLVGAASLRKLVVNISGNISVMLPDERPGDGSPISPSTPSAIVLPFLSHIALNGSIPPTLLRLFNTPALRRLDLNLARRAPTPRLPRGHHITDLRLNGAMPNVRLLQSLPELIKLELGRDTPGRLIDLLAQYSDNGGALDPDRTPIAPSALVPFNDDYTFGDEVLCRRLDTLTLRGCERIKKESIDKLVERRAGSLRKVRMFGCEGIGLKGELRRTGTWTGTRPTRHLQRAGTDVVLRNPRIPLSRRDTDSGFVVVSRDIRRSEMATG